MKSRLPLLSFSRLIADSYIKIDRKWSTDLKAAMKNNQTTQQQSSESSDSKIAQSNPAGKLTGFNSLFKLLNHHPWLIWSGVWTLLLAITAIALFSLTHTGLVEQEPEQIPIAAENPAATSSQTGNPIPLLLLGAVALSCAAGSLVIYKRRTDPSWPRQLRKRVKSSSAQVLTRRQQRQQRLQESPPVPTPVVEPLAPVATVPEETEPVVTVVPPEESHPLDSGEESLAEMMDIRKQKPLSSILRDS